MTEPVVGRRLPALSYFFPAHNEAANLRGLVEEALATLPALAETFEIIIVNDGSRDETPAIADELAAAHPASGPSTTRRTSATAPRFAPGSPPRATITSRSRTATGSSRSPTSAG